jgi:hypothetical protein
MDNVQNCDSCINTPSSQTYRFESFLFVHFCAGVLPLIAGHLCVNGGVVFEAACGETEPQLHDGRSPILSSQFTNIMLHHRLHLVRFNYASKMRLLFILYLNRNRIARVFRRDSPPTRSRRSTGSGEETSSMLTSVEGNAVQGRIFYN